MWVGVKVHLLLAVKGHREKHVHVDLCNYHSYMYVVCYIYTGKEFMLQVQPGLLTF